MFAIRLFTLGMHFTCKRACFDLGRCAHPLNHSKVRAFFGWTYIHWVVVNMMFAIVFFYHKGVLCFFFLKKREYCELHVLQPINVALQSTSLYFEFLCSKINYPKKSCNKSEHLPTTSKKVHSHQYFASRNKETLQKGPFKSQPYIV